MELEQNQIDYIKKELDRRKGCPQDIITFDDGDFVRIVDLSTDALESLVETFETEQEAKEYYRVENIDIPKEEIEEYGDTIIPFGRYKGSKIKDIPESYLRWLVNQNWIYDDLRETIEMWLLPY